MQGEEYEIKGIEPVTDLCYFAAGISLSGNVHGARELRGNLKLPAGTRTHLVIACQNSTLLHFVLDPALPMRKRLIDDIIAFSTNFNGIQLDLEDINPEDRENFISLVQDVKKNITAKTLSVALPAKISSAKGAYDFTSIGAVADKIIIMAYDEHWGGNGPGPVASLPWCERVAAYAMTTIPHEKLVMGIPFYGRSWQDKKNDRALRFCSTEQLMKSLGITPGTIDGSQPSFRYQDNVTVTVYYEDASSLKQKVALYQKLGVSRVAFWRIGQEPREFWEHLSVKQ